MKSKFNNLFVDIHEEEHIDAIAKDNEKEILKLCCEFANFKFESIDKMLKNNTFYAEIYYTEILENPRNLI